MKTSLVFATLAMSVTLSLVSPTAHADTFQISYLAPGVQAQSNTLTATYFVETFNSGLPGGSTSFGGSPYSGTYSGHYQVQGAGTYGGAGGTGQFINTVGSTYTLSLSSNVNYFGFWLSAQDPGYILQFYNGSTLVYSFTPTQLFAQIGDCSHPNPYCGNPNLAYLGQDPSETFAFVNFFDNTGTFNKVVFTETISTYGYESDNHTVAVLSTPPTGTPVGTTPEPSSIMLLGTGITTVATAFRRRFKK